MDGARDIPALTGLRAPAAWAVVAFHFVLPAIPDTAWLPLRVLGAGYLAVSFFFVLSGFVLAHHYAEQDFLSWRARQRFWIKRFARVYPLYVASLAMGAIATFPKSMFELGAPREIARVAMQITLLNAWHHVAMFKWNWAAWSLSVEAAFYVAFPWLFTALRGRTSRALWQTLIACWALTFVAPALYTSFDPDSLGRPLGIYDNALFAWYLKFFPLHRYPEFVAGLTLAVLWERRNQDMWRGHGAMVSAGALAALAIVVITEIAPYAFLQSGVLFPVFLALIAGLAEPHFIARVFSSRAIVLLGHASYATYILHVPLYFVLGRFDGSMWKNPSPGQLALYLAIVLATSLAAYRFVEEPCRRWILRNLSRSENTNTPSVE
ncbi:MAG: acyltransferase [Polyangiaceae bacterium]